ncbi:unnamed protein product [Dicrocoelium dendriticum]|nr:unnamed protein product [Dicrocoelium dendriticum]
MTDDHQHQYPGNECDMGLIAPSSDKRSQGNKTCAEQKGFRLNEPILSKQPCPTPELVRSAMKKCDTERERVEVLLRLLEKQKKEASSLAEMHRQLQLTDLSEELDAIADDSAYAIAAFNRRLQQRKPIAYTFHWANMPQSNVNLDLSSETLEVTEVRPVDYRTPSDCGGNFETCVHLELAFPSEKRTQKLKTNWGRYMNGVRYLPSPLRFNVASTRSSYVQFLELNKQLKATVFYNRGLAKRSGVFGWTYFTLTDLLHSANVSLSVYLNAEGGVVPGYLKIFLRQRLPIQVSFGSYKSTTLTSARVATC